MRRFVVLLSSFVGAVLAQKPPYDVFPPADRPYYRVRHEAADAPHGLAYAANFTLWVPPEVRSLRGVLVHQHGCGEGSCKSGLTGAYDLHWQALARKHRCALLSPAYEQPDKADCQLWCDPRRGSDAAFQKALNELARQCGHPELASVPWALWGHSGGGHWAGGMALLHPDRVVAAWLRSGVPPLTRAEGQPESYIISKAAVQVPLMCNLGTKEGVTDPTDRFAGVWPGVERFFVGMRSQGALIGVAVDPLTSHECGNQRYLAIPWLDACLTARLPARAGVPLRPMQASVAWLAPLAPLAPLGPDAIPVPAARFTGVQERSVWLPDQAIARAWVQYSKNTAVTDPTPPPAPKKLQAIGNELTWEAEADVESGLARFVIERDGRFLANFPTQGRNPYGRPVFQNLQYSDTPPQPLAPLRFIDTTAEPGKRHRYRVFSVNTAGLKSK